MTAARTAASTRLSVAISGRHIAKRYGHVQALSDANVTVHAGEVVAIFGDNGAGKTTFLKTLLGMERPDAGDLVIADRPVRLQSIRDAQQLGVEACTRISRWHRNCASDRPLPGSWAAADALRHP